MSAPYIIPFNHQPVTTGVTTSTYTVASGKYARVNLDNCVLPLVNAVALTSSITHSFPNNMWTGAATQYFQFNHQCDRVTWAASNNAGNNYVITFSNGALAPSASNYEFLNTTSFSKTGKLNGFNMAYAHAASGQLSVSLTFDISFNGYLWLKAGDVVTFTSGSLAYEEYNVIS